MEVVIFEALKQPHIADAFYVRHHVFSLEQGFDPDIDQDEYDCHAIHAVVYDEKRPVATARLILKSVNEAKIGRVAVIKSYRKKGVGARIMKALIEEAKQRKCSEIALSSQLHAKVFYEQLGFKTEGKIYLEEGAEHIMMRYQQVPWAATSEV